MITPVNTNPNPAELKDQLQNSNATIYPFREVMSTSRNEISAPDRENNPINASELFSMFTADIIKQEVVFTR